MHLRKLCWQDRSGDESHLKTPKEDLLMAPWLKIVESGGRGLSN